MSNPHGTEMVAEVSLVPRRPLPLGRRLLLHLFVRRPLTPEEALRPHERLWLMAAGAGIATVVLAALVVWGLSN